ncbi:hypothetical protein HPB51_025183 [Rhipicephalus microplus]|uniref:Uncharacterized protein n=1 Tax=Rhipicephalus microplus TaxID=6941 RepID=A0A9J6ED62_RHIMP|nr:hypothetical protein HPB51_025183 [Rhipicephalus microplus]
MDCLAAKRHQYLGSGNPLRNGYSVDEDNGIAKSHDEAYKRATSRKDVFAADHVSAALFLNYFRRTVNGLSSVGLNHSLDTDMWRVKKGETNNSMKPQSYTSFQEKDHTDLTKSYCGLKITPGNEDQDGNDEKSIRTGMVPPSSKQQSEVTLSSPSLL